MNYADILDIYTVADNTIIHLASGEERAFYTVCEDGMIVREGSGSAFSSSFSSYYLDETGTQLEPTEMQYLTDGFYDEQNPYFCVPSEYGLDTDYYISISREEYLKATTSFQPITVSPIPLSDFVEQNINSAEDNTREYIWGNRKLQISLPEVFDPCTITVYDKLKYFSVDLSYMDCAVADIYISDREFYEDGSYWGDDGNSRILMESGDKIVFMKLPFEGFYKEPRKYGFPYDDDIMEIYMQLFEHIDELSTSITVDILDGNMEQITERLNEKYESAGSVYHTGNIGNLHTMSVWTNETEEAPWENLIYMLEINAITGEVKETDSGGWSVYTYTLD